MCDLTTCDENRSGERLARLKRPSLRMVAYTARVKSVIKSQKAQAVASSYAGRFRRTGQEVVHRKGGATDN